MSKQRNFRFTEKMKSHLNEIDQWFNSTDKSFDFKANKTKLIDFCLFYFVEKLELLKFVKQVAPTLIIL